VIALEKEPAAIKCSNHHTISLITNTANIVARKLRRTIDRKIETVLGEVGFRRGKGTGDAFGILRIISE